MTPTFLPIYISMINMSFQKADIKAISMCSPALTDNPFPMVGCEIIQVNEAYQIILLALTWDQMFGFGEQSLVSIFDLIQNVPQNGKVEGCGQISPFITRFLRIKSPSFLQMAVMIMNLIQSRFVTKYKVWRKKNYHKSPKAKAFSVCNGNNKQRIKHS